MNKKMWATVAMALSMASVDAMASDLMEGRVNLEEGCLVAVTDSRTLFGELIIKLVNDGKLELLNSIE